MEVTRRNVILGVLLFFGAISIPSFLDHYLYWISGQARAVVIQQRWDFVALNIAAFLLFLIPLRYRRKADWKSLGVYTAFIVSLFVEMYGIPLSIYLSSAAFFSQPSASGFEPVVEFSVLGQTPEMTAWMLVGLAVTVLGMLLVAVGWLTVYRNREGLATSGIYRYSRHPQYLGIILIAVGWFIGWPTLLTTVILPILVYTYYKLSIEEEQEVREEVGEERYREYAESTPRFI
ncbi:MAG: isoprenylcysteine carboxylmethyltransferase family protein [Candidatus Nanohaloarchaea archaeon]